MTRKKAKTRADLQREIAELKAQLIHTYHFATADLHKASTDHMMASGVIVTLTAIGGRQIIHPVMIKDGLSHETVEALRRDMFRTFELLTEFKPKEAPGGRRT